MVKLWGYILSYEKPKLADIIIPILSYEKKPKLANMVIPKLDQK